MVQLQPELGCIRMSDALSLTDIAVLKTEVSGLHAAVSEVGTKMDILLDMHVKLSILQERSDQLMVELGRVRDGVNKELGVLETKTDNIATHSKHTRDRFEAWLNRAIGGVVVGGLLMGALQYSIIEKLDQLNALASEVQSHTSQLSLITRAVKSQAVMFDPELARKLQGEAE